MRRRSTRPFASWPVEALAVNQGPVLSALSPALRFDEHDRPRDGAPELAFVISASAVPNAGGGNPRAARTGPYDEAPACRPGRLQIRP